jgi:hypothetical protein
VGTILPEGADALSGAVAAWALVHGLSSLLRGGMIPPGLPDDAAELTRAVAVHLASARRADR